MVFSYGSKLYQICEGNLDKIYGEAMNGNTPFQFGKYDDEIHVENSLPEGMRVEGGCCGSYGNKIE